MKKIWKLSQYRLYKGQFGSSWLSTASFLLFSSIVLLLCSSAALAAPFIDNGSTVTDQRTGLEWQKQDDGVTRTWGNALSYCEGLNNLGGHSDWRLPNIIELESLTDDSRYNPAIDPVFTGTISSYYRSSTTDAGNPSNAWAVHFGYGDVSYGDKVSSSVNFVRCVRTNQPPPPPDPLALTLSPNSLPTGTQGAAYSQSIAMTASNGTSPYLYNCSGSGVAGLTATPSNTSPTAGSVICTVSGTPTATGTYTVSFTVSDASTPTVSTITKSITFTVSDPAQPGVTQLKIGVESRQTQTAGDPKIYQVTLPNTCTTTTGELRIRVSGGTIGYDPDMIVKKSENQTKALPTKADYDYMKANYPKNLSRVVRNGDVYYSNFTSTYQGETVVVYKSDVLGQADTYYIYVYNAGKASSTLTVKAWCY